MVNRGSWGLASLGLCTGTGSQPRRTQRTSPACGNATSARKTGEGEMVEARTFCGPRVAASYESVMCLARSFKFAADSAKSFIPDPMSAMMALSGSSTREPLAGRSSFGFCSSEEHFPSQLLQSRTHGCAKRWRTCFYDLYWLCGYGYGFRAHWSSCCASVANDFYY